jgi:signal transduction histidine kinase
MSAFAFGVGISGMRERLRRSCGDLTPSRAESGTLVAARIPLLGSDLAALSD